MKIKRFRTFEEKRGEVIGSVQFTLTFTPVVELSKHALERQYRYTDRNASNIISKEDVLDTVQKAIPELQRRLSERQINVRKTRPSNVKDGNEQRQSLDSVVTIKNKETGVVCVVELNLVATANPRFYVITVYRNHRYYPKSVYAQKFFIQV